MLQAIAIDDEPVALDIVRRHLSEIPYVNLIGIFSDPGEAHSFIQENRIDLVILDINMPGTNGLELARLLPPRVQVVFVTAHADFAVDGFELAAADFLLKPISRERLEKATSLVLRRLEQSNRTQSIFVKDGHDLVRIDLDKLLYVKADDNYLYFTERSGYTISRMKMIDLEKKMPANFQRVHKSYLVNLDAVQRLEAKRLIIGDTGIPVSRSVLTALKNRLERSSPR